MWEKPEISFMLAFSFVCLSLIAPIVLRSELFPRVFSFSDFREVFFSFFLDFDRFRSLDSPLRCLLEQSSKGTCTLASGYMLILGLLSCSVRLFQGAGVAFPSGEGAYSDMGP